MSKKLTIMSSQAKRPDQLSDDDLRKVISAALKKGPYIGYSESEHAAFDHPERHIDINDVLFGLERKWNAVKHPAQFNPKFGQWKYQIFTEDIEGDDLTIVVAVDPRNEFFEVVSRW